MARDRFFRMQALPGSSGITIDELTNLGNFSPLDQHNIDQVEGMDNSPNHNQSSYQPRPLPVDLHNRHDYHQTSVHMPFVAEFQHSIPQDTPQNIHYRPCYPSSGPNRSFLLGSSLPENKAYQFQSVSPLSYGINTHTPLEIELGVHANIPHKLNPTNASLSLDDRVRRRKLLHTQVERRRRDKINSKLQELSHLVPRSYLQDERTCKDQEADALLSPALEATSTNDISITAADDLENGPSKRQILTGSASWIKDLMQAIKVKYQQQEELKLQIAERGGVWPYEETENDRRMKTELFGGGISYPDLLEHESSTGGTARSRLS